MSKARRFLICDDQAHAATMDALCCAFFQQRDGNRGSQWSGVFTDGTVHAIEWDEQLRDVFGDDPALVIQEDAEGEFEPVPVEAGEP